jgi:hypothetical protein
MYSLILTTARDLAVDFGEMSPEAVNGTPDTGVAESFGLLAE